MKFLPAPEQLFKEGLIVIGGAIIAALIISQTPGLKAWIKTKWGDADNGN